LFSCSLYSFLPFFFFFFYLLSHSFSLLFSINIKHKNIFSIYMNLNYIKKKKLFLYRENSYFILFEIINLQTQAFQMPPHHPVFLFFFCIYFLARSLSPLSVSWREKCSRTKYRNIYFRIENKKQTVYAQ